MPVDFRAIKEWYTKIRNSGATTLTLDEAWGKDFAVQITGGTEFSTLPPELIRAQKEVMKAIHRPEDIEQVLAEWNAELFQLEGMPPELVYDKLQRKVEEEGLMSLSHAELEEYSKHGYIAPVKYKRQGGFLNVPSLEDVRDIFYRGHDFLFTFGEVKRTNPQLYEKLMKAFGKRGAGVEKAIDEIRRILPKEGLSLEEDVSLALTYEDKRLKPSKELKKTFDRFAALLDELEKIQIEEGIFTRPFQERMIEENRSKIEQLMAKLLHPDKSKQIKELLEENENLRNMRYLTHGIVAKKAIENKINSLKGKERRAFLDRLSYMYKKRRGRLFLKDYLESGLITKEDVRMTRLAAVELSDYYVRSSYKSLHDYATTMNLIQPTSKELREAGWLNQREIGVTSPELKNKLVHPLYASALAEMAAMRKGRGGLFSQVLGMVKIGQFIKPTIIVTYNVVQKYMKGMYSLNPVTEAQCLVEATKAVMGQTALYHRLNADNLYQFPYEVTKGTREEEIKKFIHQNSKEYSRLLKLFEKATDMSWAPEDLDTATFFKQILMAAHRGVAQITWAADKIQRTQSYLILRKMGTPHDEAVRVAAESHGAYSKLSEKYKKLASKALFVYSFRFLMPIEIGKILAEPAIDFANWYFRGEKIPKHRLRRWVLSWAGAIALPVLIDQFMQSRGFKKEGRHLGPLAWKWSREVTVDGKKQEVVIGMNYILNMPVKYWNRLAYYNPIQPQMRPLQALGRAIKWEVHPVYRIFFWDIANNKRSFGSGMYVYDPSDSLPKKLGDTLKYVFGQSFRFYGGMMDAAGEGSMSEKERVEQEKVLNAALSDFDQLLVSVFGYSYVRMPLKDRQAIASKQLKKEIMQRAIYIERRYKGDEKKKRIKALEEWSIKCEDWIKKGMK